MGCCRKGKEAMPVWPSFCVKSAFFNLVVGRYVRIDNFLILPYPACPHLQNVINAFISFQDNQANNL